MNIAIEPSWKTIFQNEFEKEYFKELTSYLKEEYAYYTCFPPDDEIFNAFNICPFDDVKVVIIGQDPYHGANQANGLCFSVNDDIKHPPSLVNIFKELQTDVGKEYPESGNLKVWAKQGVLLLNATLTVREHKARSHQKKGWEIFTDTVIKTISKEKKKVVFLLWGGYAKQKVKLINTNKHTVLTSGHPSPLSANRGFWFGNSHFSKCNEILLKNNRKPILW